MKYKNYNTFMLFLLMTVYCNSSFSLESNSKKCDSLKRLDDLSPSSIEKLNDQIRDVSSKHSLEISGSITTKEMPVKHIYLYSNKTEAPKTDSYKLRKIIKQHLLDTESKHIEIEDVDDQMIKDFLTKFTDEEIIEMSNPLWDDIWKERALINLVHELKISRFFNEGDIDSGIEYLKINLGIDHSQKNLKSNPVLLNRVFDMIALIRQAHEYDNQRLIDNNNGKNLGKDISMNQMFQANKSSFFEIDNPKNLSTGVCRDIAALQGYILNKLGINKENGFRVFVKSYDDGATYHANLLVNFNQDGKQYNHIFNYGEQIRKQVTTGSNLSSMTDDDESVNDSLMFKLYELSENGKFEIVSKIPTDFGKTLIGLMGADLDDISPGDFQHDDKIVLNIYNPVLDYDFKIYTGKLRPQHRSRNNGFIPAEKYLGLSFNKHFKHENNTYFESDSLFSTAMTYRNKNIPFNKVALVDENQKPIMFEEDSISSHNVHLTFLYNAQAKLKFHTESFKSEVGARFLAFKDFLPRDGNSFAGDSYIGINLFAEASYFDQESKKDPDYIKIKLNNSTSIDFKDVQHLSLDSLTAYFHHLSLSIEGRKKLAKTKIGSLYLKAMGQVIYDNIAPSTFSEITLGIKEDNKHDFSLSSAYGGRINPTDPNFKSSTDRRIENTISYSKIGEQTKASLNVSIINPLDHSLYGNEFYTNFRYDY